MYLRSGPWMFAGPTHGPFPFGNPWRQLVNGEFVQSQYITS